MWKVDTDRGRVERRLVGAQGGEVGGHALGVGGAVGQGRRQGRPGQSLVAEQVVLTRADGLASQRVEERSAGVTAAARGRSAGSGGWWGGGPRGAGGRRA